MSFGHISCLKLLAFHKKYHWFIITSSPQRFRNMPNQPSEPWLVILAKLPATGQNYQRGRISTWHSPSHRCHKRATRCHRQLLRSYGGLKEGSLCRTESKQRSEVAWGGQGHKAYAHCKLWRDTWHLSSCPLHCYEKRKKSKIWASNRLWLFFYFHGLFSNTFFLLYFIWEKAYTANGNYLISSQQQHTIIKMLWVR